MKNLLSINFRLNRPKAYTGKGDKYLPKVMQNLANLLRKTQKGLKYEKRGSNLLLTVLQYLFYVFYAGL